MSRILLITFMLQMKKSDPGKLSNLPPKHIDNKRKAVLNELIYCILSCLLLIYAESITVSVKRYLQSAYKVPSI